MKGYKGFDKNMKCRRMQYEVGKEFSANGELELCENGLHFCKYPLDVFKYYDPATSKFAEVEATGEIKDEDENLDDDSRADTKICTNKLKVCAEIGIPGLVHAAIEYIKDNIDTSKKQKTMDAENTNINSVDTDTSYRSASTNTSYRSAATNTGIRSAATNTGCGSMAINTGGISAATNTGDNSVATNTGYRSAATNIGDNSASTNTGNSSVATNTGDNSVAINMGNGSVATNTGNSSVVTNRGCSSVATNTGCSSVAINTGNNSSATNTGYGSSATNTGYGSSATNTGCRSAATNTGNNSVATNTGNDGAAVVTGKNSIAVSVGHRSIAKGSLGSWIVLAEWGYDGIYSIIKNVQCFKVDGKTILPDTFYKLVNGKPVVEEVDEEMKARTEVKPEEEE